MFTILRWLLVIPMAIAAWFVAFIGSIQLIDVIYYFCPIEHQVSGMCTHAAYDAAESALLVFGAALAAVLVILAATITAPSHKAKVAAATLILGLGLALWLFLETDLMGPFVGATVAGIATFVLVLRRNRWRRASGFRQYELFI